MNMYQRGSCIFHVEKRVHLTFSVRCRWGALQGDIQMQMPGWGWCKPSANQVTGSSLFPGSTWTQNMPTNSSWPHMRSDHSPLDTSDPKWSLFSQLRVFISHLLVDGEEFGGARVLWGFCVHRVVSKHFQRTRNVESLVDDLMWESKF